MTPIDQTMSIDEVRKRALAYAIPGVRVDGNDPEAVYEAVSEAVARGRAGDGPTLIEAVTFRFKGHYFGDQMKYIPREQLEEARRKDPMVSYRERIVANRILTVAELDAIDSEAAAQVEAAVRAAVESGFPAKEELDNDLYVNMKGVPA
ncbi:pyruvate/2-oxoglutarate dehydrogenase complex, dehydrogenase component alpha subunit [Rhodococcus ruber BKS 20-38]|uniref:Pyruvate/2-oxoglutarate dehydrogenase complex, dehydrogenase component alpha subunit n=2 Tax=Rhodococcus ruber TaxID=1830 RepID=M3A2T4_9NOCA|nr:pyruvate/2-oxoglutarate dehydrogenase complex, dehydrogenase component alpha subunit [Rhodococcus ruber BKS 20-38]